ncbi:MAG: hypothetical protein ACRDOI_28920 [Trebonia sp.]
MTEAQEPGSAAERQPDERPPGDGDALDLVGLFADDELSNYEFRNQQARPAPADVDRLS